MKMSLKDLKGKLSKTEMSKIIGGTDPGETEPGGDCQKHGEYCSTADTKNCCNGLICADYSCAYKTL